MTIPLLLLGLGSVEVLLNCGTQIMVDPNLTAAVYVVSSPT